MTKFWYGKIQIDSVQRSSVVAYGQNMQSGFTRVSKTNEGFGELSGKENIAVRNIHFVNDADDIDAWRSHTWGQRDEM